MNEYPYNDYRNYLMHYAKGEKAKDHKYLYIDENGNYVYHKKSSGHGGGPSTLSEQFLFDARPSTWSGHGGSGRKFSSGHGGGSSSTSKSIGGGTHGGSGRSIGSSGHGGSGRKFSSGHGGGSSSTSKSIGGGTHGGSGRSIGVNKSIGGGVHGGSGRKVETKEDRRKKSAKKLELVRKVLLYLAT